MRYNFEWMVGYTLTEYTIGLLVCSVIVVGLEVRPNLPPDDEEFPDSGGCVGLVIWNRWFGWTVG